MRDAPHILVVDNYDSFVYNIVQYLGELGARVTVYRNDAISPDQMRSMEFDGVLVSPGPGHPRDAGYCLDIIRYCAENGIELLGICLGHQALAEAYGVAVDAAPELLHGRSSLVHHENTGVFVGAPNPLVAGRYHSLVVLGENVNEIFEVTARSHGLIMGMRHRQYPLEGVQFHPESVLTQDGYLLLANWLERCGSRDAVQRSVGLNEVSAAIRAALPQPTAAT